MRKLAILQPIEMPKPEVDFSRIIESIDSARDVRHLLRSAPRRGEGCVVLDWETDGKHITITEPVGIGLAWGYEPDQYIYFHLDGMTDEAYFELWDQLETMDLVAHNVMYDAAVAHRVQRDETGNSDAWLNWVACTFALYHYLGNDGYFGQKYGLKFAQVDLLGWAESNERRLIEWSVRRGYIKKGPQQKKTETREEWLTRLWRTYRTDPSSVTHDKSKMYLAPPDILGEYCILDCISTLMLLQEVLEPALADFPELVEHHEMFMRQVRATARQVMDGIVVDVPAMRRLLAKVKRDMDQLVDRMWDHPRMGPEMERWEDEKYDDFLSREPNKWRKIKQRKEPAKYNKDGSVSKNWLKWDEWRQSDGAKPQLSKNWIKWDETRQKIEAGEVEKMNFDVSKPDQIRWLLFGAKDPRDTPKTWGLAGPWEYVPPPDLDRGSGWVRLKDADGDDLELDLTDSGLTPVSELACMQFGEVGQLLIDWAEADKIRQFVESYLDKLQKHEDGTWRIHPTWNMPGTITCRNSGSDPNFQQLPKKTKYSEELLGCFIPAPGRVFIQADWSSLEDVVLAELARDPTMLEMYGPDANPNIDGYLHVGYNLPGMERIREHYDRENPTAEGKKHAKVKCKSERDASKIIKLGKNYGMGPAKMCRDLRLRAKVKITMEQAKSIDNAWREEFAGNYRFQRQLETEWRDREGWVLGPLGYPIACDEDRLKDLTNRVVQRTGHDILMWWIDLQFKVAEEWGLDLMPKIADYHDESIHSVPEDQAERGLEMFEEATRRINEWLGGYIKLKAPPKVAGSLAGAKLDED